MASTSEGLIMLLKDVLRNKRLVGSAILMLAIVFVAVFPGLIAPHEPYEQNLRNRYQPPELSLAVESRYRLGTDRLGRDILSRTIHAARISVFVGLASVFIGGTVGVSLGVIGGYYRGPLDVIIMRLADIQLAVPPLLLVVALVGVLGASLTNVIMVLAISSWVVYARTARSLVLSLREGVFVEAVRALGARDLRILAKHVLPNVVVPIVVIGTQQMAHMIIRESSLSFLGIGVPIHVPTWGAMISEGRGVITRAWWVSVVPGVALLCTVLVLNFLGDGVRDTLSKR